MSFYRTLNGLIETNSASAKLKRGSRSKTEVKALQNVLNELGFSKELNWDRYGADGGYGGSTRAAVAEFMKRNDLSGDPDEVSTDLLNKILSLYEIVDDLRHIKNALNDNAVESRFHRGSKSREDVAALQTMLNLMGYGEELNWAKYGADGGYGNGTVNAVKAYATQEGVEADGEKLTDDLANRILQRYVGGLGDEWASDRFMSEETTKSEDINLVTRSVVLKGKRYTEVSDGEKKVYFRPFRKGVYTFGKQKVTDFIQNNKAQLANLDITDSALNVIISVSENEGNLDAINTWDNSFMTFGMFQWTIGARNDPGELPALFAKIQREDPDVFQKYYGKYGIDVSSNTGEVYGNLLLNGQKINLASEKVQFRTNKWSYIFWRAGQDNLIQAVQIEHALARLKTFYWKFKINGFSLANIITSEYGVGLILDNHVNRPGYVKPCIRKAMEKTGLLDPTNWTTEDEMKVVNAYIKIRATYGKFPMTHANGRAATTKKYLNQGLISKERGSFNFATVASRDTSVLVPPPFDMKQEDHPTIKALHDDEFTEYE